MHTVVSLYLRGRGGTFQDPQCMPEAADSTEPYVYYAFSYANTPMIKFSS